MDFRQWHLLHWAGEKGKELRSEEPCRGVGAGMGHKGSGMGRTLCTALSVQCTHTEAFVNDFIAKKQRSALPRSDI